MTSSLCRVLSFNSGVVGDTETPDDAVQRPGSDVGRIHTGAFAQSWIASASRTNRDEVVLEGAVWFGSGVDDLEHEDGAVIDQNAPELAELGIMIYQRAPDIF